MSGHDVLSKFEIFSSMMKTLTGRSLAGGALPLNVLMYVNPAAGGFTIKSRWNSYQAALKEAIVCSANNPGREVSFSSSAAQDFSPDYLLEKDGAFNLIITAGGDGTHLQTLSRLYHALEQEKFACVKNRCAVIRLPLGTGNDAADDPHFTGALSLVYRPVRIEFVPALRLVTSNAAKGPFTAFNILSVGLDAFVTHMVNKVKGMMPGDSYKLWVDIAALFYDRIYKIGRTDIKAFDESGRLLLELSEKTLLFAVGASGGRTYGSQKHILPDERNVCIVRQMPLLRKVGVKNCFTTGTHIKLPECRLLNAHKIEFSSENPVLAQMDGETVLLKSPDFPARIELSSPLIPVLKLI